MLVELLKILNEKYPIKKNSWSDYGVQRHSISLDTETNEIILGVWVDGYIYNFVADESEFTDIEKLVSDIENLMSPIESENIPS